MKSPRLLSGLLVLAAILTVAGVIATLRPVAAPDVNLIAFVDTQGSVMTMRPDGALVNRISPDVEGFFTWPTWSPDGRSLAYSGVVSSGDELQISLYASDIAGGAERVLYASERGEVGLLAQGVVHYPLWSPDGANLAFVVATSQGLSLFMDDLTEDTGALHLLDEGPLWMSWSHDSTALAVHRGNEHFVVDAVDDFSVSGLDINAAGYRVPAWRPARRAITLQAQAGPSRFAISTAQLNGAAIKSVTPLRAVLWDTAFLWSPSGEHLAVVESPRFFIYRDSPLQIYRSIAIVPAAMPQDAVEFEQPIIAFFWSPDGSEIAFVTLSETPGALRWALLDVAKGEAIPLVDFIPSAEQLTMLQFFDQYAHSHSVWSPDGGSIVFAGDLLTDSVAASMSSHPGHSSFHIVVVDTTPVPAPHVIGEGIMGFWSPR